MPLGGSTSLAGPTANTSRRNTARGLRHCQAELPMRVLVTGANGLVGSRLIALLARRGHHVTGLGRGPQRARGNFDYLMLDLADEDALASQVLAARPDAILN